MFIKLLTITKGKKMAREDWVYMNFDKPLIHDVDKTVELVKEHGVQKYQDRKHFVVTAIRTLLDMEAGNRKEECCSH